MIFVPLPFVVALLLLILLAALLRTTDQARVNRPFLALIALCALQTFLVGLRWGYDLTALRYVLPVLAACVPPLTLASFRCLIARSDADQGGSSWLHWLPPVVIALLLVAAPQSIDVALVALFLGYAVALLQLGKRGPDALDEARFDKAVAAHRALVIAAAALCISALFDLVIWLDFEWTRGDHAALIAGNGSLLGLLMIGATTLVAAGAKAFPEPAQEAVQTASPEQDREILDRVETLLAGQKLFLDENLTLSRLARRAGVPARQISGAINRLAGRNVSQYINDYRIAEACQLLRQTDISVTAAMLQSGFQTKSNFNREFRRVTSLSPATWRDRNRQDHPTEA